MKYPNRRRIGCPEMGSKGLYNDFGLQYDQNNYRNAFLDHENIGIDTLTNLVWVIVCVLCLFFSFRLMAAHKRPLVAYFGIFSIFYIFPWKGAPIPFKWAHFEAPTHMLSLGSDGPRLVRRPFWILGCEKFPSQYPDGTSWQTYLDMSYFMKINEFPGHKFFHSG